MAIIIYLVNLLDLPVNVNNKYIHEDFAFCFRSNFMWACCSLAYAYKFICRSYMNEWMNGSRKQTMHTSEPIFRSWCRRMYNFCLLHIDWCIIVLQCWTEILPKAIISKYVDFSFDSMCSLFSFEGFGLDLLPLESCQCDSLTLLV